MYDKVVDLERRVGMLDNRVDYVGLLDLGGSNVVNRSN